MYDYAKIYQSLAGYEEIVRGRRVREEYRRQMMATLLAHVKGIHGEERCTFLPALALSLILSMIPLHLHSPSDRARVPAFLRLARHISLCSSMSVV